MARGRKPRSTVTGASSAAQSRLSFNNSSAKVTKSSQRADDASKKAETLKLSEPAQSRLREEVGANVELTPEPEVKEVDVVIRESPRKAKTAKKINAPVRDEREVAADKITDAQIKSYWKAEEDSRLAPRVHQSSLSLHEKILRHFDLSSQYGPCIGIPRLARWKRANMLGLEPPTEVLAVLLREENSKTSQGCGKIAYIDELGGGKAVLVE